MKVVGGSPAGMGKPVMHGTKSLEIQTPALVIACNSFFSSVRFKQSVSINEYGLEMGKGLVVGFVLNIYSILKHGKNKWRTPYKVHSSSPFIVLMKVSCLRFLSFVSRFYVSFSCSDDCSMVLDKVIFVPIYSFCLNGTS